MRVVRLAVQALRAHVNLVCQSKCIISVHVTLTNRKGNCRGAVLRSLIYDRSELTLRFSSPNHFALFALVQVGKM